MSILDHETVLIGQEAYPLPPNGKRNGRITLTQALLFVGIGLIPVNLAVALVAITRMGEVQHNSVEIGRKADTTVVNYLQREVARKADREVIAEQLKTINEKLDGLIRVHRIVEQR